MADVESITIIPDTADIYLGDTIQYKALATYDDGSVVDVTEDIEWSVISSPSIAEFDTETVGLLNGLIIGDGIVVAELPGFSPSTTGTLSIHNPLIVEQADDLVNVYRSTIDDFQILYTSQYQTSTKLLAWSRSFMEIVDDIKDIAQSLSFYFSFFRIISKDALSYVNSALTVKAGDYDFAEFDACVGDQLDVLGVVLGVKRKVAFNPTDGASPILDDDTYRILLKNQILKNHWDGRAESLQETWKDLFPGGKIIVQDNQNMTVDVIVTGAFTQIIVDLIENDYIVPRPQGVLMNYYVGTESPSNLPFFGFGRDDEFVSGFDKGHWA